MIRETIVFLPRENENTDSTTCPHPYAHRTLFRTHKIGTQPGCPATGEGSGGGVRTPGAILYLKKGYSVTVAT